MVSTRALMKALAGVLVSSILLGGAIGAGWAVWGDIKGSRGPVILVGLLGGGVLALPIIAYVLLDTRSWPWWKKGAASLLPVFVLSFCVPYYGGVVMFLQLCALLIPGFISSRAWSTFLLCLTSGLAFLGVWYFLYSNRLVPLPCSDDIFVFYPFVIGLVAMASAIGKGIGHRLPPPRTPALPCAEMCREVIHGSSEYHATVALRDEVLRRPLGLAFSPDELSGEKDSFHLAGWRGSALVACVVLKPLSDNQLQLRQFAVREDWRGQGIGRALALYAEAFAKEHGYEEIILHSRETAQGFYAKLGYQTEGERFIEVTIPHVTMRKRLPSSGGE